MAQFRVKFRVKFRVPGSGFQVQGSVLGHPKFWVQNGTHTHTKALRRLSDQYPEVGPNWPHFKSADPWSGLLEHLEWGRSPPPTPSALGAYCRGGTLNLAFYLCFTMV
jgi:hypothetical protein